ncbi:LOW QUALITY PROTEIN: von Willebrand factor A domain-containing protein 5A-like [Dugong dugon]
MVRPCGLLTRREEPAPLNSVSVTLSIQECVAGVSATLNYENKERVPVEAFFVFPMDEDSAVYSFEALVDGKIIVAELQDKMKAHASYENAVSQGCQAFLLEEDMSSRDVFCCKVGNLYPGSKVALTLKHVQELPLEPDGALRFMLPAILNPRYHLSRWPANTCLQIKAPAVALDNLPYTLSIIAIVSSQHGIKKVQSNCCLTPLEYLGNGKTTAQISLVDGHKFDRDVQLLIYYSEVHTPSVAVEMGKLETSSDCFMEESTVIVSFYPNIPETQPPITCGFIFLMDRSGSMQAQCPMSKWDKSQLRIDAAKETLILLLKSLPVGCYSNVFGFGFSYESFFQDSVRNTQHTMEEAVRKINLMKADLGGTEILTPLNAIYGSPTIPGHPLQLFVFTDGEVSDTFSVIREVKSNSKRHRCFSFGIGEGVSTSLIKGIAWATGGTSEFISGQDRMQSKLTVLKSLDPYPKASSSYYAYPKASSSFYTPAAELTRSTPCYSNMPCQPRNNGGSNVLGRCRPMSYREMYTLVFGDNHLVQLILLQKADGSWNLNEGLALVLGMSVEDILAALPYKDLDSSSWATILAVLWLHAHGKDLQSEWDLLARKVMVWIHINIVSAMHQLMRAAVGLLKSTVNPKTLTL